MKKYILDHYLSELTNSNTVKKKKDYVSFSGVESYNGSRYTKRQIQAWSTLSEEAVHIFPRENIFLPWFLSLFRGQAFLALNQQMQLCRHHTFFQVSASEICQPPLAGSALSITSPSPLWWWFPFFLWTLPSIDMSLDFTSSSHNFNTLQSL